MRNLLIGIQTGHGSTRPQLSRNVFLTKNGVELVKETHCGAHLSVIVFVSPERGLFLTVGNMSGE